MTSVKQIVSGLRDISGWNATSLALTFTPSPVKALTTGEEGKSPYKKSVIQGATIVPRFLFFVNEETTTSRLGMSSGRVGYRSQRSSLEDPRYKKLPDLTGVIERRFVFDVHLGSTIVPYRALNPWRAILPLDRDQLIKESQIEGKDHTLFQWWTTAKDTWDNNKSATNKLSLRERLNYQNGLTRQLMAPAHRVVYSASGNSIAAARLTNSRQIIEHKLYWMPARNIHEAQYLSAVLNAPLTTETISDYQSRGLFGKRDIDTYVWRLPIPIFNSKNPLHQRIVDLAQAAETIASQEDLENMGFQKARKTVRNALSEASIQSKLNAAVAELLGSTPAKGGL